MGLLRQASLLVWSPCRLCSSLPPSRVLSPAQVTRLEQAALLPPAALSLQDLLASSSQAPSLYSLVRRELPTRLARLAAALPLALPAPVLSLRLAHFLQDYTEISWREVEAFPLQLQAGQEKAWGEAMARVGVRLGGTTEMVAEAVLASGVLHHPAMAEQLQHHLPLLLRRNLSCDLLVSLARSSGGRQPSVLQPRHDLLEDVTAAYQDARYLCEQHLLACPDLALLPTAATTTFPSLPNHNYLILFEIFKNSLRATVEHHQEGEALPPVELEVREEGDSLVLELRDRGGGLPQHLLDSSPRFFSSSAELGDMSLYQGARSSPLAGHGFGLGLARLYCSYWGGGLEVEGLMPEGWQGEGTTVRMVWCKDPQVATENLEEG